MVSIFFPGKLWINQLNGAVVFSAAVALFGGKPKATPMSGVQR
jgi:hypothetical protein